MFESEVLTVNAEIIFSKISLILFTPLSTEERIAEKGLVSNIDSLVYC